jgi:SAM-dependent methyltransferase
MDDYTLLTDLHKQGHRQGPGCDAESERALDLLAIDRHAPLNVADIGCGTGASTILLARLLRNSHITAVDFLQDFLDVLNHKATKEGVADRISTLPCSMDSLPFADEELDVIWSEGAIYNMGFARGVGEWRRFLKPAGLLVVSEITWLTDSRPEELQQYWHNEYPEINTASAKIGVLEKHGYSPIGYFVLPSQCWLDEYYRPMQARFADFLSRNGNSQEARKIVDMERAEINLYETYKAYMGYGMYVARKVDL